MTYFSSKCINVKIILLCLHSGYQEDKTLT